MRTRDRIRQIVSSGHFAGGFVPYGYRAINKGRVNKRDQPVKDLEINPDEAAWVREVFTKVAEEGASGYPTGIKSAESEKGGYRKENSLCSTRAGTV